MAKSSSSFAREKGRFKTQRRVLVLCEDSKSCLTYLEDAARFFRSFAVVEVAHCGRTDPKGIVEEAIRRRGSFEDVYCVIDEDAHESFGAALKAAANAKPPIDVVASYPCYEFWLLLHFRRTRSPCRSAGKHSAGARMVKLLGAEMGMAHYNKGTSERLFESLLGRLPDARARSAAVLQEALQDGAMNPSTSIHTLIEVFERLGNPEPST